MNLKSTITAIAAVFLACSAIAQKREFPQLPEGTPLVPGTAIVKFRPSATFADKARAHRWIGARVIRNIQQLRIQVVKLPNNVTEAQAVAHYNRDRAVEYAGKNYKLQTHLVPNDPRLNEQYLVGRIDLNKAWDLQLGKPSVKVAVIDNGFDMQHPDLKDKYTQGFDFWDNDPDPTAGQAPEMSHGTHVAGIAAASTDNGIGIAGVAANASVMPLRAGLDRGISIDAAMAAIVYAAEKGADVINMSFGAVSTTGEDFWPGFQDAINFAWTEGVAIAASAGNHDDLSDFGRFKSFPAAYENVISVAASDAQDVKAGFSGWGNDWVHVTAPGVAILSGVFGGGYASFNGTSMSSPVVAGVLGLMASHAVAGTTNEDLRDILFDTTDPAPLHKGESYTIHGRVNAFEALSAMVQRDTIESTPIFLTAWEGRAVSSTGRVFVQDGIYTDLIAKSIPRLGQVASISYKFTVPVEPGNIESLAISTVGKQTLGATGQIYAWNYDAQRWDNVRSYPMGSDDVEATGTIRGNVSAYLGPESEVRVLLRSLVPVSVKTIGATTYRVDYLRLKTTYFVEAP